jgi:L-lactate dehydrogenase complex protein LldE
MPRVLAYSLGSSIPLKISLFIPCFVDQLFPKVAINTVEVLERLGHEVIFPKGQTCCGQPAFNSGYWDDAREVARRFLDVFADAEVIVSPSGSCTTMVRQFYSEIFHDTSDAKAAAKTAAKTFELTEFLVRKLGIIDVGARFEGKVTWHDACHGLRELHMKEEPRQLLRAVRGLQLVEMKECETCCGFGGTFSIKFPNISVAMDEVKIGSIEESGAEYVVSGDSSCLMQINGLLEKRRSKVKALHLAEILASR